MVAATAAEGDENRATGVIIACWICTGITGVCLVLRYGAKCWMSANICKSPLPGRVWGLEDVLFAISWAFDIAHMFCQQKSYNAGFGRHFSYLTQQQRSESLKWQVGPQDLIIASTTLSRAGMIWLVYQIFGKSNNRIRTLFIALMVLHLFINLIMMLELVLQCGPNPYRISNRLLYLHYSWEGPQIDKSIVCHQDIVITSGVGYLQGALNAFSDFIVAYIAAYEIWQYSITALKRSRSPIQENFPDLKPTLRHKRVWQTITLCGPIILSGAASVVKVVMMGTMGKSMDITYNMVFFTLWVKIESYSLLIATCAPVARMLFNFSARNLPQAYVPNTRHQLPISLGRLSQGTRNSRFDRIESIEDLQSGDGLQSPTTSEATKVEQYWVADLEEERWSERLFGGRSFVKAAKQRVDGWGRRNVH